MGKESMYIFSTVIELPTVIASLNILYYNTSLTNFITSPIDV